MMYWMVSGNKIPAKRYFEKKDNAFFIDNDGYLNEISEINKANWLSKGMLSACHDEHKTYHVNCTTTARI